MEQQEKTLEEFKAEKKHKKALMTQKQNEPYEIKVKRAEIRAKEFISTLDGMGYEAHVSVGGLDRRTNGEWLPSKTHLVAYARKAGWSIGKSVICPRCRKYGGYSGKRGT